MDRDGIPTLMPDAAQPGTPGPGVMIGNFELQTVLGRGGMGEVWKAWDKEGERPVAETLDYAHRHKVLHRDIKPKNILVVGGGSPDPSCQSGHVVRHLRGRALRAGQGSGTRAAAQRLGETRPRDEGS